MAHRWDHDNEAEVRIRFEVRSGRYIERLSDEQRTHFAECFKGMAECVSGRDAEGFAEWAERFRSIVSGEQGGSR